MILAAPTVTHSGTHFMQTLFRGWCSSTPWQMVPDDVDQYVFCHLYDHNMDALMPVLERYPAIIPLRHPARIYESIRVRRGAYNKGISYTLDEQFINLIYKVDKFNPCYIVLDSPHKQKWLDEANKTLGTSFTTNWDPTTVFHNHDIPLTDELKDAVPAYVMKFFQNRVWSREAEWEHDNRN